MSMKRFGTIFYTITFVQLLFSIGITTIRYTLAQQDVMKQTDKAYAYGQSIQLMSGVITTIETTLDAIATFANKIVSLRENNVFPYGMTAADHELIFGVLGSYLIDVKEPSAELYIALDDGTFFYMYASDGDSEVKYREPGSSGYSILDIQERDPNYKYYIACVDWLYGEQSTCTMTENMTYVACIDNCEPIPCNTSKNDDASSNITYMCRNYETKVVEDNNTLGYIPNTHYCVNQYYQPEQRPGYVVIDYDKGGKTTGFGNCTYYDGNNTMVNRTLSGDYAFCGPNKTCDTTYQGGHSEDEKDFRLNPFYIQAKAAQGPTWKDPMLSFTTFVVSYSLPFYSQPKLNDTMTDSLLFEGVIGMNFYLSPIAEFLKTIQDGNTGQRVFIVEDKEPYYLIGSSMQQFTYNTTMDGCEYCGNISFDGVLKWVLISNKSELCPYLDGSIPYNFTDVWYNCTTIRASIDEFFDTVSRRAFQKYNETSFVSGESGIYFKKDDTALGTQAYVAYSRLYTNQNLKWHVFVVSQVDRSTSDALLKGNVLFPVICVVATIGFLTCFTMFYCFYRRRTEKAVIHADWRFTCAFIVGCAFINCSSYALLGENTDQLCMLRMWSFNGLFVGALSPLFVKVWRMAKLLNASAGFRRTTVTNFQAWLYTLPLVILELIFLMIVSIVDPPHATEELPADDGSGDQVVQCSQNNNVFVYLQTIFNGSLVLVGCVLAYRTRDLDPKYGEAKQLAFSMYNIAFTGLITILIVFLVQLDQVSKIVLQTVSVLWGSCFCSLSFVLPRLLQVQKDNEQAKTGTTSHTTSHTKSSSGSYGSSPNISSNIASNGGPHEPSMTSSCDFDAKANDFDKNAVPEENSGIGAESYSKLVDKVIESVIDLNNDIEQKECIPTTSCDINPYNREGLFDHLEDCKSESEEALKLKSESRLNNRND